MESATPKEFFEKTLPSKFKPEKALGIDVKAQVNLTGLEGGDWVITIKDQKLQVSQGTDAASTLTMKASDKDFIDMVNGRLSAEKAFFTGKIKFSGDIRLALKLRETGLL